jgi:hypothetical protein
MLNNKKNIFKKISGVLFDFTFFIVQEKIKFNFHVTNSALLCNDEEKLFVVDCFLFVYFSLSFCEFASCVLMLINTGINIPSQLAEIN